jgi:16S rRNA (guanine527-N7)-methyltransferase
MIEPSLLQALEASQALGFLGPGDAAFHVEHSGAFAALLGPDWRVLDLGSGGGVPGLVLGVERPDLRLTLLDVGARRCEFLRETIDDLPGLATRVEVAEGRAELLTREPDLRGAFDAVVSRSFGSPPVTAECGAPFLKPGGVLLVSEPPDPDLSDRRWPAEGVKLVGLRDEGRRDDGGFGVRVMVQEIPCPDIYPRRVGLPGKRPLF